MKVETERQRGHLKLHGDYYYALASMPPVFFEVFSGILHQVKSDVEGMLKFTLDERCGPASELAANFKEANKQSGVLVVSAVALVPIGLGAFLLVGRRKTPQFS